MTLVMIHERLSTSMILFSGIAAVWGLVLYFRRQGIGGNFWGILAAAELLFLAQGIIGVLLWLGGGRPGRSTIHVLYGIVAVITLPAFYTLSRGRDDRRGALGYTLALLFLVGISLRAIGTAR
jgi:hypothetical protein